MKGLRGDPGSYTVSGYVWEETSKNRRKDKNKGKAGAKKQREIGETLEI